MKEATGELNMTIVIVIAVAVLAAFFYLTIWPMIRRNYNRNASCAKAICTCKKEDQKCQKEGLADCYVASDSKKDYDSSEHFRCPWKG